MEQLVTSTEGVAGPWATIAAATSESPSAAADGGVPASLSQAVRAVLEPASNGIDPVEAERRTKNLADAHYENFSVVSLLLPKHLRQDFCNIYAFCRVADDLGDELADKAASTRALAELRRQTIACREGKPETVLFVALAQTLRRHDV